VQAGVNEKNEIVYVAYANKVNAGYCTPDKIMNQWYFGQNAGIDFNSGGPIVINNSNIDAINGAASIADTSGNILFYTNGMHVWNKNGIISPNSFNIGESAGYTQNSLIIPIGYDFKEFLIFTNGTGGIKYSQYNMDLNGGAGDVGSLKNVLLVKDVTEKMAGVSDGKGNVWVVTHDNNNRFLAYKVDNLGNVSTSPIISEVGSTHTSPKGYLKFSQDGTKAALALSGQNVVEIFDFDPATGKFSNPVIITNVSQPYGLEFSSDKSKLYIGGESGGLYQYDITSGVQSVIESSKIVLSQEPSTYYTSLLMGPDGKIYVGLDKAGVNFLGVINDPNTGGIANYDHKAVDLGSGASLYSLPNQVANYSLTYDFTYEDTCSNIPTKFKGIGIGDTSQWKWEFLENNIVVSTQTGANPQYQFSSLGQHKVRFIYETPCGKDTIEKEITINQPPTIADIKDTVICVKPPIEFDSKPEAGITKFLWSNGEDTNPGTIEASGYYWVRHYKDGCYAVDTFKVHFYGIGDKGNENWYFGNGGGLNFKNDPPEALSGGQLNSAEGAATISDPSGNLLFYTDGVTVYDKDGNVMENGIGLEGADTSAQSALIVPHPKAQNIFYVFTTSPNGNFSYSVVDMSENGGKGKVIEKNKTLFSPSTEKLAGLNNDYTEFWVLGHEAGTDRFYAYKIDMQGFKSTPVISNIGSIHNSTEGAIKFSGDGSKVAVAVPDGANGYVEIFDFNKETGTLSNPVKITNMTNPYSLEFSEDNSYLYVSTGEEGDLFQYNITSNTAQTIMDSRVQLNPDTLQPVGALQVGPDGKIYVSQPGKTSVGVINEPEADSTAAGFDPNGVALSGGQTTFGLPNFLANHFKSSSYGITHTGTCVGETTTFMAFAPDTILSWTWKLVTIPEYKNTVKSLQDSAQANYSVGTFHIEVILERQCKPDTVLKDSVTINPYPTNPFTVPNTSCDGSPVNLNAQNPDADYFWITGEVSQTIQVDTSGAYDVFVSYGGCSDVFTAYVTIIDPDKPADLGPDQTPCIGDSVLLNPGSYFNAIYQWSNGSTDSILYVKSSGNYHVRIVVNNNCPPLEDDVVINFVAPPVVNLGMDQTLCSGETLTLTAGTDNSLKYLWSTGDTDSVISVNNSGTYSVKVNKTDNCEKSDTIVIVVVPSPTVDLPDQEILCEDEGSSISLMPVVTAGANYQWSTGETSQSIDVTKAGVYLLTVTANNLCTASDSVTVLNICEPKLFIPNAFTPNGDGNNDRFTLFGSNLLSFDFKIFNQWGEVVFVTNRLDESWDGTYRGKPVPDGAYAWRVEYTGNTVEGVKRFVDTGDVSVLR
ncbi:MAG TPA: gliding motility-associated C-terminal domain-containing protein, partial [Cytophagaceae bacterium]